MSTERTPPHVGMKVRSVRRGRDWSGYLGGAVGTVLSVGHIEDSFTVRTTGFLFQNFTMAEWATGDIVPADEPGAERFTLARLIEVEAQMDAANSGPLRSSSALDRPSVGVVVAYDPPPRVTLDAYRGKLARALFDEELRAEALTIADPDIVKNIDARGGELTLRLSPTVAAIQKVLDVMWSRTKPAERKRAEFRAQMITRSMEDMFQ